MRKIIYFGTYEKSYPRNRMILNLLKEDFSVEELHIPLWEKTGDKTGSFLKPSNLVLFFFTLLGIYFKLFFKLLFKVKSDDIIMTGYIGQFDLYLIYFFRFFFRKNKIIANPLVSFYDTIVEDRQIVKEGGFVSKRILNWERKIYSICEQVWVDTEENKKYFVEKFNLAPEKVKVVYVGAEDCFFCRNDIKKFEEFTVLFYGKYIPLHGLNRIVQAISLMPLSTKWMFIGKGQLYDTITKDFESLIKMGHQISIVNWVDYENLNSFINGSHVTLGVFGDSKKASRVIPNKLFQAVSAKSVVLTMDSLAVREIFDEETIFMCKNNPENIKKSLLSIKDNFENAQEIAKKGYEKFNKMAGKQKIKNDIKDYILLLD